jgi:hypothetical protein
VQNGATEHNHSTSVISCCGIFFVHINNVTNDQIWRLEIDIKHMIHYTRLLELDDITRIRCLNIYNDSSSVESVGLQYNPKIRRLECTFSVERVVVVVRSICMELARLIKTTVCQL